MSGAITGPVRTRARGTVAGAAAIVTLDAAVLVIVFGVLVRSGVYGSRLAWLLGVALPLLVLTMVLARLSTPAPPRAGHRAFLVATSRRDRVSRVVFLTAFGLVAVPVALVLFLLATYVLLFAAHGLSLLV